MIFALSKASDIFSALANALKNETVQGKTHALYEFLMDIQVPGKLSEWTMEAEARGALAEAREHRMIWGKIMELFDQAATVSGNEKISISNFTELLTDGLDSIELSLIPPQMDAVTIASFDKNSLNNLRAIYILGANEGVMPRRPSAGGILSNADRALLFAQKDK